MVIKLKRRKGNEVGNCLDILSRSLIKTPQELNPQNSVQQAG
ncbi:hypothetical protein PVE_R2G0656 [Pseudomonas veronii 1YdBTEX2]|uniref:Uncharacterized protein n=1 Tax=Pseudomonas veronii 1YdBTEX2 TaxID=1295141 RepID=A0A1D3K8V3_PSEVE|nr:hypothetical protein PVE_R2G0656 [Pseudomonas veronii 1YdBTEX2]